MPSQRKNRTTASNQPFAAASTKATRAKPTAARSTAKPRSNSRGPTTSRKLHLLAKTGEERRRSLSASPVRHRRTSSSGSRRSLRSRKMSPSDHHRPTARRTSSLSRGTVKHRVADRQRASLKRVLYDDQYVRPVCFCKPRSAQRSRALCCGVSTRWADKQEAGFTNWINHLMTPAHSLLGADTTDGGEDSDAFRQLAKARWEARTRRQAFRLYHSQQVDAIMCRLDEVGRWCVWLHACGLW